MPVATDGSEASLRVGEYAVRLADGLAARGQALLVGALVLPVVGLDKALRERRLRRNAEGREAHGADPINRR